MKTRNALLISVALVLGVYVTTSYGGDIISCDSLESCPDGSVPLTNALLALEARMAALEADNIELKALLAEAEGPQGEPGPAGPPGPIGPAGLAGVLGYETLTQDFPVLAGESIGAYIECPTGKKIISGGWYGPNIGAEGMGMLARNEPALDGSAWSVIFRNTESYETYIRLTIICATVSSS